MNEPFVQLIDEALAAVNGQVIDKSRAVDRLLDLRAVARTPALVAAVDDLLRGLPGRTMVLAEWWVDALNGLRLSAELETEQTVAG